MPGVEDHDGSAPGIVLVVGVGNDLRGDDGAGRAVIEQVLRAAVPGVRAIWSQQLVPELVEQLTAARLVVFVDAADAVAGVVVQRIEPGPPAVAGHSADPSALLGLARLAGYPVPTAYLISVPAGELGLGTGLTPTARDGVPAAVHAALDLARAALSGSS